MPLVVSSIVANGMLLITTERRVIRRFCSSLVAGTKTGSLSWTAWQDIGQQHAVAGLPLDLDSKPDELSVDVCVEVGVPVGCQARTVVVQRVASPEYIFEDDGRRPESEGGLGMVANLADDTVGFGGTADRHVPVLVEQCPPQGCDCVGVVLAFRDEVLLKKSFVCQ